MRIVFGAVISLPPFSPGMAWNWMNFAAGLRALGHDVLYLEEVEPDWWLDSHGRPCDPAGSVNRETFRKVMQRFGLEDGAAQICRSGAGTFGASSGELRQAVRGADLLINMSGHITSDWVLGAVDRRVFIDQDPVYTQLWYAEYGHRSHLDAHDAHFSVGLNLGTSATDIPDCGVAWRHVLPAVMLEHWPAQEPRIGGRFTTVASWSGYRDLLYRGEWYGSKHEEFRRFADLPRSTGQQFEVAVKNYRDTDPGIQLLKQSGWHVSEGGRISGLADYRSYIGRSRAEIGIAKNAYVKAHSGWFSDRSAHYLASGKPVLAQSTGFERRLPAGSGLISFGTLEEATAAVEEVCRDYKAHARDARELAEEHFDHRKVLPVFLEEAMAPRPSYLAAR